MFASFLSSIYKFHAIECQTFRKIKVLFTFHSLIALNFILYIDILCTG